MGFTRTAYAGPETGVRDRASYVLEQGEVRFVVTSALREEHEFGTVERAAIATYGDTIHTFVDRAEYGGPFLPGYVSASENGHAGQGLGLTNIDHVVGNVELGRMDHWVEYYERAFGMTEMIHFSDEDISTEYSAL